MTSSTSSSISRGLPAALLLLAAALPACVVGRPPPAGSTGPTGEAGRAFRVAVLPCENMSTDPVPLRDVRRRITEAVRAAGLEVVADEAVDGFLERHRIRYTGGIAGEDAAAAGVELGVQGVLLSSVQQFETVSVPRLALALRLVAADPSARVVWLDSAARTGDDAPGLLGLGLVRRFEDLEQRELGALTRSLAATVEGRAPVASPCPSGRRFRPRVAFRSRQLGPARDYTIAVLPFVNETSRRRAGDLVAQEFVRQLAAAPRVQVVEPGVVRDRLLRNRVVMEGGVSVETGRLMLDALRADLVLAGYVREFSEGSEPAVSFTVLALEREHGTVVWESTSHAAGLDGVWFFGAGRISTASALACRMAREAVKALVGKQN